VHFHEVLFTHHFLDHVAKILGHGITEGLSYQLTRILDGEFDLKILVPIGIHLEFVFSNPLSVKANDAFNFEVVRDIEFFQSGPDCK
jgi:trehalose-6-phosphate synthase